MTAAYFNLSMRYRVQ